jgi:hypothetical protein
LFLIVVSFCGISDLSSVLYQYCYRKGESAMKAFQVTFLAAVLLLSASASANLSDGLVAHWTFDDGAGDVANDSAGTNHGAVYGSQWTDGILGGALEFDGISNYVSLSNIAVTTTEFTIAAWANQFGPAGGAVGNSNIFVQRDDVTADNHVAVGVITEQMHNSPYAAAGMRSTNGAGQLLYAPKRDYLQWHHYALVVSSIEFIFYIDGIEVDRAANHQAGNYVTAVDYVSIGRNRYNGRDTGFFNGMIDDVRIYNKALTPELMDELYQMGSVKPPLEVAVDIKPGSCKNPVNAKSMGVLPVAILGSEDLDVTAIDIASIRLATVAPIRSDFNDVSGLPLPDANDCPCPQDGPDDYADLTLKFKADEIIKTLGEIASGDVVTLQLEGTLTDGTLIQGAGCINIKGAHKPQNNADPNNLGKGDTDVYINSVQEFITINASSWSYPACWDYPTQCYGDADGSGQVDTSDWPAFRDGFGKTHPDPGYISNACADFNKDGAIDTLDWPDFRDYFGSSVPADCPTGDNCGVFGWSYPDSWDCPTQCKGDANCDGVVDLLDQAILEAAFSCSIPASCYDPRADFDRNGTVDTIDIGILQSTLRDSFGQPIPADCPPGDWQEIFRPQCTGP